MKIGLVATDQELAETLEKAVLPEECARFSTIEKAVAARTDIVFAEWCTGPALHEMLSGMETARRERCPVIALVPLGNLTAMRRAQEAGAADVLFSLPEEEEIREELDILRQGNPIGTIDRDRYLRIRQEKLIGASDAFERCLSEMRLAAQCEANVLLLGDTGTGKEVFAQAIHELSRRSSEPYVAINCSQFAGSLMESELFGHVKGAFTGAVENRQGRFETVGCGTLLIDEIGRMNTLTQTKLLRVLDQRVFSPVGTNREERFRARLICAANLDFEQTVSEGEFHKDLRGRIDQFRIVLPSLRDRCADIPILIDHFLRKHGGERKIQMSRSAQVALENYDYPDNVRELENAVREAVDRRGAGKLILLRHLPRKLIGRTGPASDELTIHISHRLPYKVAREQVQKDLDNIFLSELLRKHQGNHKKAAAEAGIDRKTFSIRIREARDRDAD